MAIDLFAPKGIGSIADCIRAFWSFTTKMPKYNREPAVRGEREHFVSFFHLLPSPLRRSLLGAIPLPETSSPPPEPATRRSSSRRSPRTLDLGLLADGKR